MFGPEEERERIHVLEFAVSVWELEENGVQALLRQNVHLQNTEARGAGNVNPGSVKRVSELR